MQVNKLDLGAFKVLLDKFESDFKSGVQAELTDLDIDLQ